MSVICALWHAVVLVIKSAEPFIRHKQMHITTFVLNPSERISTYDTNKNISVVMVLCGRVQGMDVWTVEHVFPWPVMQTFWPKTFIGSVTDPTYQVIRVYQCLTKWAETVYQPWFLNCPHQDVDINTIPSRVWTNHSDSDLRILVNRLLQTWNRVAKAGRRWSLRNRMISSPNDISAEDGGRRPLEKRAPHHGSGGPRLCLPILKRVSETRTVQSNSVIQGLAEGH
ncbi:uncharacterized protein LY79DRAFT_585449 [Colletotrichum navitas]|uniref:Uncharacterized protein n=1 Tax=Colletotrichum navitas TaxID=681940 RepID=A0AAD8PIL1_9PEZI|nr:uncharacterized protein LY79DRAFT_585449 [Colletotrichum navitas]KAK1561642.1 hypothetical protein LY79DRAFT_585449 [Colletotrichum navitas]